MLIFCQICNLVRFWLVCLSWLVYNTPGVIGRQYAVTVAFPKYLRDYFGELSHSVERYEDKKKKHYVTRLLAYCIVYSCAPGIVS